MYLSIINYILIKSIKRPKYFFFSFLTRHTVVCFYMMYMDEWLQGSTLTFHHIGTRLPIDWKFCCPLWFILGPQGIGKLYLINLPWGQVLHKFNLPAKDFVLPGKSLVWILIPVKMKNDRVECRVYEPRYQGTPLFHTERSVLGKCPLSLGVQFSHLLCKQVPWLVVPLGMDFTPSPGTSR